MKLFEISKDILALEDALESDTEAPETIRGEALKYLEELKISKAEKIENCVALLKNWEALETAIKAEETALKARRDSLEKRAEWLKNYLSFCLLPGEKFESAKCKVSWRKSESVEIQDESIIPEIYQRVETVTKIDKKAIKDAYNAGGEVPGAIIVKKNNIVIK